MRMAGSVKRAEEPVVSMTRVLSTPALRSTLSITRGAQRRSPCCISHTRLPYSGCHASSPSRLVHHKIGAQTVKNRVCNEALHAPIPYTLSQVLLSEGHPPIPPCALEAAEETGHCVGHPCGM